MSAEVDGAEQRFHAVQKESSGLKKELRLFDLIGIQLLSIVGLQWVGVAGKLGPSHIMFWLPAVLLFYIPSGIVVAYLVKEMPLEGGLYQWAKFRYSPLIGFLVAMNMWFNCLMSICKLGLLVADNAAYALGARAAWMGTSRPTILTIGVIGVSALGVLAWRGLSLGKWVNAAGGFAMLFLFAGLIIVAIPHWFKGNSAITPVSFAIPAMSLLNLNILGKMGFGAFGGFDSVGVFAGECHSDDPAKVIRRSVWIAAPIIVLMFIAGTASVLTFVRPESIDLVAPMSQVLKLGAPGIVSISSFIFVLVIVSQDAFSFSLMIRLPMAAGWDRLLPSWFSRLDRRYRTPVGSIVFAGVAATLVSILANAGTGSQEAFQLLDNTAGILYAIIYLVMFSIPLLARGSKPSVGVRIASFLGFLMTLLYVVMSIFPIIDVANPGWFTFKIVVVVAGLQCAGAAFYWRANRARMIAPTSIASP